MKRSLYNAVSSTVKRLKRTRVARLAAHLSVRLGVDRAVRRAGYRATARKLEGDPVCLERFEDGILRLRITNACNAKCRFCGQLDWPLKVQQQAMDPKWLYEYCKPLYERVSIPGHARWP